MKILIVDDIVINRFIIREIIKKLGHLYKEAANGKEAIDLLSGESFDMVFLDIEMPVMNGIETARYIRSKFTGQLKMIPIYAITAYNPTVLQESIDMTDFNGVVIKPYSPDKIHEIIEKQCNKA